MPESVIYQQDGPIVTLTLNEPATRNAISPDIIEQLVAATHRINADMSVSAVILTGAGEGFSSGGNVKNMAAREGLFTPKPATTRRGYLHGIQRIPEAMYDLEVPSIAAVNGAAVGAGCDLSMMCDIRVASTKAQFAESFLRVGLISGDGGAWYLPRVVGLSKAMEMTFTAEFIDAERALAMGLCSHLVPPDQLMAKAREIAGKIAQHPAHSVRLNKKLMRDSYGIPLKQALELASCMQAIVQSTDDQLEAVKAMLEKRKPAFKGA